MTTITINSEMSLQEAIGLLREWFASHKFLRLSVKKGVDRSLSQNSIGHVWYGQIARELREDSVLGWRCYCKLHHGVPILRTEDDKFREFYDGSLKLLTYEKKIKAMEFVPVTSLMTKEQKSAYLVAVQADFMARGVRLEFPQEAAA